LRIIGRRWFRWWKFALLVLCPSGILVITANLDGHISLGRAAELLHLNRFNLTLRFSWLGLPLRVGPASADEVLDTSN
jgi:hypothetical protein